MKKLLGVSHQSKNVDFILLLLRITIAALMLTHGLPKMEKLLSGDPVQFASVFGLSPEVSIGLTVFSEVFCSILIFVGFGTRFAVIPLIITMVVAAFVIHAADPFAKQEMAIIYLIVYVVLLIGGSGRYSLDSLISSRTAFGRGELVKN